MCSESSEDTDPKCQSWSHPSDDRPAPVGSQEKTSFCTGRVWSCLRSALKCFQISHYYSQGGHFHTWVAVRIIINPCDVCMTSKEARTTINTCSFRDYTFVKRSQTFSSCSATKLSCWLNNNLFMSFYYPNEYKIILFICRLSGTPTSMWARLWALLSRSWSRADLIQVFCRRSNRYRHNRNFSSNPCFLSLCSRPSLHLPTSIAPHPDLCSRSSPLLYQQQPRQQCTSGRRSWCEINNQSTFWNRNRVMEQHPLIFLILLTRMSRERWGLHVLYIRWIWKYSSHSWLRVPILSCLIFLLAVKTRDWQCKLTELSVETKGGASALGPRHRTPKGWRLGRLRWNWSDIHKYSRKK